MPHCCVCSWWNPSFPLTRHVVARIVKGISSLSTCYVVARLVEGLSSHFFQHATLFGGQLKGIFFRTLQHAMLLRGQLKAGGLSVPYNTPRCCAGSWRDFLPFHKHVTHLCGPLEGPPSYFVYILIYTRQLWEDWWLYLYFYKPWMKPTVIIL